jgi:hypothetical protein
MRLAATRPQKVQAGKEDGARGRSSGHCGGPCRRARGTPSKVRLRGLNLQAISLAVTMTVRELLERVR